MRAPHYRSAILAAGLCPGIVCLSAEAQESEPAGNVFRIGMVAPDGTPVVEGVSAIKSAYGRALGRSVEVIVARDYAALVDAHARGRIDYAVYTATAFAAASLRCGCVRALAAPVRRNGAIGLRSVLVTRPAAEVNDPATFAIGPGDSLAGRLAPLALHPEAGEMTFRDGLVDAATVSDAERMFLAGEASGYFGWVLAWREDAGAPAGGSVARLREAGLSPGDYTIEWQSDPIRFGPHAVRADLDEDSFQRLRRMLTEAPDEDLVDAMDRLHGGGFEAVDNDDYEIVVSIVRSIGR